MRTVVSSEENNIESDAENSMNQHPDWPLSLISCVTLGNVLNFFTSISHL